MDIMDNKYTQEFLDSVFTSIKPCETPDIDFNVIINVSFYYESSYTSISRSRSNNERYKPIGYLTINDTIYLINSSNKTEDKIFQNKFREDYEKNIILNYAVFKTVEYWNYTNVYINEKIEIYDNSYDIYKDLNLLNSLNEGALIKVEMRNGPMLFDLEIGNYQVIILNNKKMFLCNCYSFSNQDPNCFIHYDFPIDYNIKTVCSTSENYDYLITKCDDGFYEYKGWPKSATFKACLKEIPLDLLKTFGSTFGSNYDPDDLINGSENVICIIQLYKNIYRYIDVINDNELFTSKKLIDIFCP